MQQCLFLFSLFYQCSIWYGLPLQISTLTRANLLWMSTPPISSQALIAFWWTAFLPIPNQGCVAAVATVTISALLVPNRKRLPKRNRRTARRAQNTAQTMEKTQSREKILPMPTLMTFLFHYWSSRIFRKVAMMMIHGRNATSIWTHRLITLFATVVIRMILSLNSWTLSCRTWAYHLFGFHLALSVCSWCLFGPKSEWLSTRDWQSIPAPFPFTRCPDPRSDTWCCREYSEVEGFGGEAKGCVRLYYLRLTGGSSLHGNPRSDRFLWTRY